MKKIFLVILFASVSLFAQVSDSTNLKQLKVVLTQLQDQQQQRLTEIKSIKEYLRNLKADAFDTDENIRTVLGKLKEEHQKLEGKK